MQQDAHQQTSLGEFQQAFQKCADVFEKKLVDYGAAWRVLRKSSVTDQIFIKIKRLRTLEDHSAAKIQESPEETCIAVVNYGIMGIFQHRYGHQDEYKTEDISELISSYYAIFSEAKELMIKKNHDYGDAWRDMRFSGIIDLIFQKILRTKQIENNQEIVLVSEGWESNYFDMIIYALFCLIKLGDYETS